MTTVESTLRGLDEAIHRLSKQRAALDADPTSSVEYSMHLGLQMSALAKAKDVLYDLPSAPEPASGSSQETAEFRVERQEIEPGATFSQDAMATLFNEMSLFILTHIRARWEVTGEPPTYLNVRITSDVG